MYLSQRTQSILDRIIQAVVLVYQAVAVVVFISTLYLAVDWLSNPFIGGFFEHTYVLNGSNTSEDGESWAMYTGGFKFGDQLLSVDGTPIKSSNELKAILGSIAKADVTVEMRLADGTVETALIPLQEFPAADRFAYFFMPEVLSLVFLIVSLWIFGLRRTEPAGRAFSMLTTSIAIAIGSLFDLYTSHYFTYVWTLAFGVAGGALFDLALGFPQEARIVIGRPYIRWIGYLVGFGLVLNAFGTLFDF